MFLYFGSVPVGVGQSISETALTGLISTCVGASLHTLTHRAIAHNLLWHLKDEKKQLSELKRLMPEIAEKMLIQQL